MKNKYELAVKYYTETKNEEQLNYAYNEFELFNSRYEIFMWYYSFKAKQIVSLFRQYVTDEVKYTFFIT